MSGGCCCELKYICQLHLMKVVRVLPDCNGPFWPWSPTQSWSLQFVLFPWICFSNHMELDMGFAVAEAALPVLPTMRQPSRQFHLPPASPLHGCVKLLLLKQTNKQKNMIELQLWNKNMFWFSLNWLERSGANLRQSAWKHAAQANVISCQDLKRLPPLLTWSRLVSEVRQYLSRYRHRTKK